MKSVQYFLIFFFTVSVLNFACKSTKIPVYTPAGTWNYTVLDTPMGDVSGTFAIMKQGDTYSGTISSDEGTGNMSGLVIENNTMKSSFMTQGYEVELTGLFEGETFKGKVAVEGYEFDVTGNRISQ